MSDVNLPVPYSSQWDSDASLSKDDCGPASIKMILNFFGENLTIDEIFKKTGASVNSLISIPQMITAINAYGYKARYVTGQTIDQLKSYLSQGIPTIALVHYGALSSRQDKGFAGGHFFDVVGFRDDGYFVNDPDFYAPLRDQGDHHFYTKSDFEKSWSSCSLDGNPNNSLLIIDKKGGTPMADTIQVDKNTYGMLVNKSTERDAIRTYLGLPLDPLDDKATKVRESIDGLKNVATGLQRQLSTAQTETANYKEKADRIQQTSDATAKTLQDRIDALESAQKSFDTERESLKGQIDQFAKDKGNLAIELENTKTLLKQEQSKSCASLTLGDVVLLFWEKIKVFQLK